jgi:SAM-dependent methyltransferase
MDLCFAAECFDGVICAQVYEHVPDADRLMAEIHRVLKPGGVCYFAAGNRLQVMEPHYRLPFLSWLPRRLSHRYVRLAGKAPFYYERHFSYPGLKRLVRRFRRIDYTVRMIENPQRYGLSYMLPEGALKTRIARLVARRLYALCPGYIWLLEKR